MPSTTGSAVLPPDRPGSPGSLIVSFAGSFLRELGGWIAVADLIRCLEAVELTAPSVRQALVRLKSRGFLTAERQGTQAGYRLTDAGLDDLATGDRRIFGQPTASVDDGWVLAVFSVPEADRPLRHRLRTELAWLGYGTVSPGCWIAPQPLGGPTRELLTAAGLDHYVTWFSAHHLTDIEAGANTGIDTDIGIKIAQWWDLDSLRNQYDEFLTEYRTTAEGPDLTDEEAFSQYLRLIDAWRMFPRLDPGLPEALLPPDWPASTAREVFHTLHRVWSTAGLRHVKTVIGTGAPARRR